MPIPAPVPGMRTPLAACSPHYGPPGLPPMGPQGPGPMLHGTPAPPPMQPAYAREAPSTEELLRAAHGGSYYHPGELMCCQGHAAFVSLPTLSAALLSYATTCVWLGVLLFPLPCVPAGVKAGQAPLSDQVPHQSCRLGASSSLESAQLLEPVHITASMLPQP